jgi:CxxC motif-containing protein (DUF1111 family)
MQRPGSLWYYAAAALVLAPVGLRVLSWPSHTPAEPDSATVRAGKVLFTHEWKPGDPLAKGGDGLGPVFNATSCAACHRQGGLGGGGGLEHNVTTYTVAPDAPGRKTRQGVVHARATRKEYQETLAHVHADLPPLARPTLAALLPGRNRGNALDIPTGVLLSQRNTPALFGAGLIDAIPDRLIIAEERRQRLRFQLAPSDTETLPAGRALRLADGRVGKFGWKAQSASLSDFVRGACANELGLGNPGNPQPSPLGKPGYMPVGLDLTEQQCDQMTAFVAALPRPVQKLPAEASARTRVEEGRWLFARVGCAGCHTPDLGPVQGLYSDLLLHRMGRDLESSTAYYPPPDDPKTSPGERLLADEWRTPPLWGVADSAPYLHDGRAATLEEAIRLHGGQAAEAARRFAGLSADAQGRLIEFLKSLRAP